MITLRRVRTRFSFITTALLIAGAVTAAPSSAAVFTPGSLVSTFGTGGLVTTADGGGSADVVVQPDGKVVSVNASATGAGLSVRRFTKSGAADTTFGGGDGIATIAALTNNYASTAHVDSLGRIYVASFDNSGCTINVTRLTAAGALDTSWHAAGATPGIATSAVVTCPVGRFPHLSRMTIASDGEVVVAISRSMIHVPSDNYDVAIYGFDTAGAADGSNYLSAIGGNQRVNDLTVVGTTVLLVGSSTPSENTGTLPFSTDDRDSYTATFVLSTFGGLLEHAADLGTFSKSDELRAVKVLADGTVAAVGMYADMSGRDHFFTAMLTVDQGTGATTMTRVASIDPSAESLLSLRPMDITVDSLGRPLVVGQASDGSPTTHEFALRLNKNLTVDTSFNGGHPKLLTGITGLAPMYFNDDAMGISGAADGTFALSSKTINGNPNIARAHSSLVDLKIVNIRAGKGKRGTAIKSSVGVRALGPDVANKAIIRFTAPKGMRVTRARVGTTKCSIAKKRIVTCSVKQMTVGTTRTIRLVTIGSRAKAYILKARILISDTDRQNANTAGDVSNVRVRVRAR